jgi:hypothetical protein
MRTAVLSFYSWLVAILAILESALVNSWRITLNALLAPKLNEWIGLLVQPGQSNPAGEGVSVGLRLLQRRVAHLAPIGPARFDA